MENQRLGFLISRGQRSTASTVLSHRVVSDSPERSSSVNHYPGRVLRTRVGRFRFRCRRAVVRLAADVKPAGLSCRRLSELRLDQVPDRAEFSHVDTTNLKPQCTDHDMILTAKLGMPGASTAR